MQNQIRNSVLVTGAEGFLGRAVTDLLACSADRVIALDSVAPHSDSSNESITKLVCDVRSQPDVEAAFQAHAIDAIIHLAAVLPTDSQRDPWRATQINVVGSLNLLEMARRFHVRRFIFGSSFSIYGTCAPDRAVSEADRAAPEDVYGAAKLYVEQAGHAYSESWGLEFVSLRIGRVVGPGARSTTSAWRSDIFELLHTDRPANIEIPYVASETVLLVHVDDVARALLALMKATRPSHTVYNAPCESWIVKDLKREVESLNPKINIRLVDACAVGNPRLMDCRRFGNEFGFASVAIAERLRAAAAR
jgi:nucleoside-diphosphate-sugar epimerase